MNLASKDYQEKRNFIRMRVETPVSIQLANGTQLQGTCHDLSGGGMLISLNEEQPVGTMMQASVSSGHSHHQMLKANIEIVRLHDEPSALKNVCKMGAAITEVLI